MITIGETAENGINDPQNQYPIQKGTTTVEEDTIGSSIGWGGSILQGFKYAYYTPIAKTQAECTSIIEFIAIKILGGFMALMALLNAMAIYKFIKDRAN